MDKISIDFIRELLGKEKFKPIIDRKYPMERIADAYNYVGTGKKLGNVIITYD